MTLKIPHLEWTTIPDWQEGSLSVLSQAGLLRFMDGCEVVYIGYAASDYPGVGGRAASHRRGDVKSHQASQQIARLKDRLELQVAFLDLPPREIREIAKELRRRENPRLNRKNAFPGRC